MAFPDYPNPRAPQDPLAPPPLDAPYRLTREEIQVLKQCNKESFYGRCVPLMAAFGLGAYYGVHMGYLKASPKHGSTPKVILGLLIGFIGGKVSYKEKCEDKILALPGGKLKESILMRRRAKDGLLQPFSDGVYNDASISYAMPYIGGNLQPGEAKSISELDTDRPPYESFDDSYRSRSDVDTDIENLPAPPPSRAVTYDELRQRNREEYESRRKMYRSGPLDDYAPYSGAFVPPPAAPRDDDRSYRPPPPVQPVQPVQEPQSTYAAQPPSTYHPSHKTPQRKNLYGDVVEK